MGVATFRRATRRKEEGEQSPSVSNDLTCPKCGRVCKTRLGYIKHTAKCTGGVDGDLL